MSNKRKGKSSGIKGFVVAFIAFIIVITGALIWNNNSLSYAGVVDGNRIPVAFHRFFYWDIRQNTEWELMFSGLSWDQEWEDFANESAFSHASELIIVRNWANSIGVELDQEGQLLAELRLGELTSMFGMEYFRELGFNNSLLQRFAEYLVLYEKMAEHIWLQNDISDQELEEMLEEEFEQFLLENLLNLRHIHALFLEVEDMEIANNLIQEHALGTSLESIIREHSLSFNEEFQQFTEDGEPIYTVNILNHLMTGEEFDGELISFLYQMEPGTITTPWLLSNQNWGVFYISHIEEPVDFLHQGIETYEELQDFFNATRGHQIRIEYFADILHIQREIADIETNSRIIR